MTSAKLVFSPLDRQLELFDKQWSEAVVKEVVWLSGVVGSYADAEEVMKRIGHLAISDSTIWRHVQKWGAKIAAVEKEQEERANALPVHGSTPATMKPETKRQGAAMDGAMVCIREEGWKELKVGSLFDIAPQSVFDKETQEWQTQAQAVQIQYVAHLGGPERLGRMMWAEAQMGDWTATAETQVVGDGAAWIWNLADEYLNPSYKTVDWYHATQHLHEATKLAYPHSQRSAMRWYNKAETLLYQGQAEKVAKMITKRARSLDADPEPLLAQATYFDNNKRRMQYMELREDGFLIGSGVIESAAKQFKARFAGPGMQWSRDGFNHLLPIRAAVLSRSFDHLWEKAYAFSKN